MFRWIRLGVLLAGVGVLVSGCNTTDTESPRGFSTTGKGFGSSARSLEPGDSIEVSIEVDGRMEVTSHRAELSNQGFVTLPLVGDVKVGGMKLTSARKTIANSYSAYYVNPPVVMLAYVGDDVGGEWGYVTVLGRVSKPGQVAITSKNGINLSAAIQLAGGFAPSAKQSDVKVTRTDKNGRKMKVSVDFEQIGQSGNAEADILLIEGDIVYVPERIF